MGLATRQRSALFVASAMALALTACGDAGGGDAGGDIQAGRPSGFTASPAYLASVIDTSTDQPYRYEATMTMGMTVDGDFEGLRDLPIMTGAFDGAHSSDVIDMSAALGEAAAASGKDLPFDPDELDLTIETVTDGATVFMHAPGWAEFVDELPAADPDDLPPLLAIAAQLGDSWGRLDLTSIGDDYDSSTLLSQLNNGQNMHPSFYLDLLRQAEGVEELGTEEIGDELMSGLAAEVSLAEMLEAQGIEPAEVAQDAPIDDIDAAVERLDFLIEVWLDDGGNVRRLTMDIGDGMVALAEELGESTDEIEGFQMSVTVDFSGHGDESIEVVLPDPTGAIDLTPLIDDL